MKPEHAIQAMKYEARNAVLSVSELSVTFPSGKNRVAVVDQVSLELAAGEILGLVGESACGKSMTGAALMGLVPAPPGHVTAGKMELSGQDLTALDETGWRQIRGGVMSMIFQEPLTALDPVFSVGSQLWEVIRRHQRNGRSAAKGIAGQLLRDVGFSDVERILRSYPHELSGGMRQRVMIAMAMSCRPSVLIADEPATALDVTTQAQVLRLIRRMALDAKSAVLLITHDLGVVAEFCDRVMVMYCGHIVEEGPVEVLFSRPRHPYTAGLLAALPRLAEGPPIPVRTIPGSVPSPAQRLVGCRFNTRCDRAGQRCQVQQPKLQSHPGAGATVDGHDEGHRFACHYPLGQNTVEADSP
ncbi:MAG TPA: ABC transporter ATP-binding protein [Xanthomonadales bacterium]|nr:ABC transporter ATP-binding protein [Xanthomonadales bacterium]